MTNEERLALGKRLKALREKNGYSKPYVALELGVSVSALEKYENGTRLPPLDNAQELAKLYHTTIDLLVETGEVVTQAQQKRFDELVQAIKSNDINAIDAAKKKLSDAGYSTDKISWFIEKARLFAK